MWQDQVLTAARGHVGRTEGPGNDNPFGRAYGMIGGVGAREWNNQPWCAQFASFAFWQAGVELPEMQSKGFKGFASAQIGLDWFRQNKMVVATPEPSDLVFFLDASGHCNHVGIVESIHSGGIATVEGNKGDMVAFCRYTHQGQGHLRDAAKKVVQVVYARFKPCWETGTCTV